MKCESNKDYDWISEKERNLLIATTGILERRIAAEDTCASDLCQHAAEKLVDKLGWEKASIDILVFVSQSPDYFLPATSIVLQGKMGLPVTTLAFDLNLGCSGYVYGMHLLANLLQQPAYKRALLLCGDVSTNSLNYKDKSTYPLFGDAGTATALEHSPEAGKMTFKLGSDGVGHEAIIIKGGATRQKYHLGSFEEKKIAEGIHRNELNLILDGLEVFTFAIKRVPKEVKAVLAVAGVEVDEVDYFVLHQANKLINDTILKKLKSVPEKFPESLSTYGNTSSASIPLTLCHHKKELDGAKKDKMILSGFGVGLSWGTVLLDLTGCQLLSVLEKG